MERILVIGACGQLGTELTQHLRISLGNDAVVASDVNPATNGLGEGPFENLDILNKERFLEILKKYNVRQVYHLAAILSAKGEMDPQFAWHLNMQSLLNVLEAAKDGLIQKVYWPSSIAVFGNDTPKENTPQQTIMNPTTVYGISKLAGERWCEYYFRNYKVDVRSLRYPGLIGYKSAPGGGTTDYAVDIFFKAIREEFYDCFIAESTALPMMYMDDAVKATLDLMNASQSEVKIRSSYNISAMSFTPGQILKEIKKYFPNFQMSYLPDYRDKIAQTWPNSIDDLAAREDWGWQPNFDLEKMAKEIISNLSVSISG